MRNRYNNTLKKKITAVREKIVSFCFKTSLVYLDSLTLILTYSLVEKSKKEGQP